MILITSNIVLPWIILAGCAGLGTWVAVQLIRQNGRLLSRLDTLEEGLRTLCAIHPESPTDSVSLPQPLAVPGKPAGRSPKSSAPVEALLIRHEPLRALHGVPIGPPAPREAPGAPRPRADCGGLMVGSPAPEFELPDLEGQPHALAEFRGRPVLLIFFNPACGFCVQMAPDLAALPTDGSPELPLPVIITTGSRAQNLHLVREHGIACPVLLQDGMEVAERFDAAGTPIGYLVDEHGHLASGPVLGAHAVFALARAPQAAPVTPAPGDMAGQSGALGGTRPLTRSKIPRQGLTAGTLAPLFRLPRLEGGEIALESFRGKRVLLVFSDPNCGPCDALAPLLEQHHRASSTLLVLMVSRGEIEANRRKAAQYQLTFPIGLQRQWEVSRHYGIFATPVAYLINEQGNIAADAAVGTERILGLLSPEQTRSGPIQARRQCNEAVSGEPCPCGRHKKKAVRSETEQPTAGVQSRRSSRLPLGEEQA
jgi:peroxiredoxin